MPVLRRLLISALLAASVGTGMAHARAADRIAMSSNGTDTALSGEAQILQSLKARTEMPRPAPNGIGNYASITQSGSFNRSTITQIGTTNLAEVSILNGSWNETTQTQKGSGNVSRLKIVGGDSNRIETKQSGNSNTINLSLENADNVDILFTQDGTGLNSSQQPIVIERSGPSSRPIEIHQSNR